MKPQDIAFLIALILLILLRKPKILIIAGLLSLLLSAPLFQFHIFFTAQRLVMYGAGFILLTVIFMIIGLRSEK